MRFLNKISLFSALMGAVVCLTGCIDTDMEVKIPESAFDGQGIDVAGYDNGEFVTVNMETGQEYRQRDIDRYMDIRVVPKEKKTSSWFNWWDDEDAED